MHQRSNAATWQTLLAFVAIAIAMRWGSFFTSVINSDESTYIVIAGELLRGKTYLRDVVDTKPIGIFWIYAALIKLFGGSIFSLRLAAAAVVGIGGWLVSRITTHFTDNVTGGYAAGFTYILLTSVYKFYGVSPNTEIYFNCFTLAAIALTVGSGRKHWLVAGLLLGAGFVIKPFVAAEALAIGLYLVWTYRHDVTLIFGKGLLLVGAFVLPVAATVAYFFSLGLLPQLWFYSVEVGSGYRIELGWAEHLIYMGDYCLRYLPLIVLGAAAQLRVNLDERRREWLCFLLLQFVLVTTVVLMTGKRFGHYQVQLHPVIAMWVGTTLGLALPPTLRKRWVTVSALVTTLALGLVHYNYYSHKTDHAKIIADYLRPRLAEGQTAFLLTSLQITYHLIERPVPLRYVHPSLLFDPIHHENFGIEEAEEAEKIIADSSVVYLVSRINDDALDTELGRVLMTAFGETERTADGIIYYRRIDPGVR